jgi:hypothetical protein
VSEEWAWRRPGFTSSQIQSERSESEVQRRERASDEAGMACFKADLVLGWALRDTVTVQSTGEGLVCCYEALWWIFVSYLLFACGGSMEVTA